MERTYTLDQLAFFVEHGLSRPPMIRAMKALGIDDEASFALCSTEATREGDVVGLYRDYGAAYGAQLESYIDFLVVGHSDATRPDAPRYSLGQLTWIHAVGLFRDDMARDMMAIGISTCTAVQLATSAAQHRTVLGVWKEHGHCHAEALERYLAAGLAAYTPGWPHAAPTADSSLDDEARHPRS
jgi:hypothetical protein